MKAKKVRILAGGLAAVIMMSNMTAIPVLADEASMDPAAAIESVMEESDADAPYAEEIDFEVYEEECSDEISADAETEVWEEAENQDAAMAEAESETASVEEALTEEADDAEIAAQETEEALIPEEISTESEVDAENIDPAENEVTQETQAEEAQDSRKSDMLSAADTENKEEAAPEEAQAEEVPVETEAEREERAINEAKKEAERIENEVTSITDVLSLILTHDTDKFIPKAETTAAADKTSGSDTCEKLVKDILKNAYSKAFDTVFEKIPFSDIVSGPLKGLILKMMGFDDDKQDSSAVINTKLDELKGETKRTIETVGAINDYGTRLDAFTSSSTRLAERIEKYQSSDLMSQNEKDIRTAALIGSSSLWIPGSQGIFSEMDYAAQAMRSKSMEGPSADVKSRNLYDLFYDYNKETSMFSGEAMNKSESYITKRTYAFASNCAVLAEALRAHERVAAMTEEEVAALSKDAREIYERTRSDKIEIRMQMKDIIETFTGNKASSLETAQYGILDALNDFYSKDRTVFIEKAGEDFKEIKLSANLATFNSESYNQNTVKSASALSEDQVKKLQNHVNSIGMNMCDYLDSVGFDVEKVKSTTRTPYLATFGYRQSGYSSSKGTSSPIRKYYTGINMKKTGAKDEEKQFYYYYKYKKYLFFGETVEKEEKKDGLLVVFKKAE